MLNLFNEKTVVKEGVLVDNVRIVLRFGRYYPQWRFKLLWFIPMWFDFDELIRDETMFADEIRRSISFDRQVEVEQWLFMKSC